MTTTRYREHVVGRPRSSFDRLLAEAPMSEGEMRALIRRAWRERGTAVFLRADLERLPAMIRAVVEGEMVRTYGMRSSA